MNTVKKFDCLIAGLAIFAMFFGAGNIIFPLALGQFALAKTPWALSGFLLTAVAMPFIGLFAMFRYQGQVRNFFGRVGSIPGFALACLTIALIGPFGAAPRCIALAHSTMSTSMAKIPLIYFGLVACILIFFFAYKENRLLKLLGYFLSPLKIGLLVWIIIKGYIEAPAAVTTTSASEVSLFFHGLKEGYNTMDLLAAFFFSPIILLSLGSVAKDASFDRFLIYASAIGAALLAGIYIGFGGLAYLYASQLTGFSNDQLLAAIAMKVLGPYAGIIVSLTVTIACLTTAIALVAAFASFIHKEVLRKKVGYMPILLTSVIITFALTTLEFQGIARLLNPVLAICYPGMIVLTFYNLLFPSRQRFKES
ncbi:MAG: branched-chain amino acid transport system II carrier protein [Verrucomicrobia bacterium]|nr:branched-chain amino acid transport system II carrier protein [Verrucomicrobiota bacterium]MBU6446187.1 branched-chain amino acid transport system II carrier protein [Verrucomicrobiota bacterium]MDE3047265.1 branched-chain amino acid transport system II carrier protein [Verrucomicrobiota bacterium]